MTAPLLEALARCFVSNRRQYARKRRRYDTSVYGLHGQKVFRGHTLDVSRGGAKLTGLPCGVGVERGQSVRVEFVLNRAVRGEVVHMVRVPARVWRIEDREDEIIIGIRFDQLLPSPLN